MRCTAENDTSPSSAASLRLLQCVEPSLGLCLSVRVEHPRFQLGHRPFGRAARIAATPARPVPATSNALVHRVTNASLQASLDRGCPPDAHRRPTAARNARAAPAPHCHGACESLLRDRRARRRSISFLCMPFKIEHTQPISMIRLTSASTAVARHAPWPVPQRSGARSRAPAGTRFPCRSRPGHRPRCGSCASWPS